VLEPPPATALATAAELHAAAQPTPAKTQATASSYMQKTWREGKGKERTIGSTAFISLFHTFFRFAVVGSARWRRRSPAQTLPPPAVPTERGPPSAERHHQTPTKGSAAITGQLTIREGQGQGELFSFTRSQRNNTAEQSREVRLRNGF